MRILNVLPSANPADGGPIEGVLQTGRILGRKHRFEIACLDAPDAPWLAHIELPVHALGPARSGYAYAPRFVPWLRAHRADYDAILVHGLWQFPGYGTWRALRRGTGRQGTPPYFVFPHGMLDPWFKRTYPLKHFKKLLYWPWAEFRVLRDARAVCFTCEEERILARQSFRFYRARERVVSYGTAAPTGDPDAQRERFFQHYPDLRERELLLFLSRIHVKKGVDLLLESFAQIAPRAPNLHLVIAGPNSQNWQSELEARAQKRGIAGRITWTGMLAGDVKWGAFHAASAFVLPSHQENFGIVVAEALACQTPVLISDKVNIWREIEDAGAGLVAPDTVEGTVANLEKWLALPESERAQMGERAAACFTAHFEIEAAARSLLEVIASAT